MTNDVGSSPRSGSAAARGSSRPRRRRVPSPTMTSSPPLPPSPASSISTKAICVCLDNSACLCLQSARVFPAQPAQPLTLRRCDDARRRPATPRCEAAAAAARGASSSLRLGTPWSFLFALIKLIHLFRGVTAARRAGRWLQWTSSLHLLWKVTGGPGSTSIYTPRKK